MAGRPAYDRDTYREDAKRLLGRGLTRDEVAEELQISRATLYRIMAVDRRTSGARG